MHIVLVIEAFALHAGGNEQSTAEIARELVDRGHRVTILAGYTSADCEMPGVAIRSFSHRRSSSVLRLMAFTRWAGNELSNGGYDVSVSMTMAVPAMIMEPRGGTVRETLIRNIVMRKNIFKRVSKRMCVLLNLKQQLLLLLERRTLINPEVKVVVAISRYVTRQLEQHYGVKGSRVRLVPNGVGIAGVTDNEKQQWRHDVRGGFNISEETVVYLFVAQKPMLKGFLPLMQATRYLVQCGHQPVIMLVGQYRFKDFEYITSMDLREQVRCIGHTRCMAAMYAACDVTVLPTYYDPCSKVVLESLVMNRPAISTRYNGASEWLEDDEGSACGRVIDDPNDYRSLANAMIELSNPDQRRQCQAVSSKLENKLRMSRHVDQLEQLMKEIIDSSKPQDVS